MQKSFYAEMMILIIIIHSHYSLQAEIKFKSWLVSVEKKYANAKSLICISHCTVGRNINLINVMSWTRPFHQIAVVAEENVFLFFELLKT